MQAARRRGVEMYTFIVEGIDRRVELKETTCREVLSAFEYNNYPDINTIIITANRKPVTVYEPFLSLFSDIVRVLHPGREQEFSFTEDGIILPRELADIPTVSAVSLLMRMNWFAMKDELTSVCWQLYKYGFPDNVSPFLGKALEKFNYQQQAVIERWAYYLQYFVHHGTSFPNLLILGAWLELDSDNPITKEYRWDRTAADGFITWMDWLKYKYEPELLVDLMNLGVQFENFTYLFRVPVFVTFKERLKHYFAKQK